MVFIWKNFCEDEELLISTRNIQESGESGASGSPGSLAELDEEDNPFSVGFSGHQPAENVPEETISLALHEARIQELLVAMDEATKHHVKRLAEERQENTAELETKHAELKSKQDEIDSLKELFQHRLQNQVEQRTNELWESYEARIDRRLRFECGVKVPFLDMVVYCIVILLFFRNAQKGFEGSVVNFTGLLRSSLESPTSNPLPKRLLMMLSTSSGIWRLYSIKKSCKKGSFLLVNCSLRERKIKFEV